MTAAKKPTADRSRPHTKEGAVPQLIEFQPKYITFDCYGTMTAFGMSAVTRELLADRVPEDRMEDFLDDFEAYRIDEVLGAYKPYQQVIDDALARTAKLWDIEHRDADGRAIYKAVPRGARTPTYPSRWPCSPTACRW